MDHDTNRLLRTEMQMIFQDPMACLNPRKKVADIIGEGIDINHLCKNEGERNAKIARILEKVGLAPEHAERYPHQFSGGQRQRVGIARALIMNPKLIIADECISALDVSIQAQVVNLMRDIQEETGSSYLFIAHDLSMVKYISDRIGVLHLGHLVETGTTDEIFANPIHPYTQSLLSAIPHPNPRIERERVAQTYNYYTSGIDYLSGKLQTVEGTHKVLATPEEFKAWTSAHFEYRG
jgi:oligopeptide transport system ATP-binding protein